MFISTPRPPTYNTRRPTHHVRRLRSLEIRVVTATGQIHRNHVETEHARTANAIVYSLVLMLYSLALLHVEHSNKLLQELTQLFC
jgi:hypothetical protein